MICFADGGSGGSGRLAARVIEAGLTAMGADVASCGYRDGTSGDYEAAVDRAAMPMSGRQFIEHIRRLTARHQHLIVDVSGAPDHTAALAYGLADLTLIPLRPMDFEPGPIINTIGLLEILSAHRRKPLRYAIFLGGDTRTLTPQIHLQIAGLLASRGVATLPIALCDGSGTTSPAAHAIAFARSVLARLTEGEVDTQPSITAAVPVALPSTAERFETARLKLVR